MNAILPAAKMLQGQGEIVGLDIEADLIESCTNKATKLGLSNIRIVSRDFATEGSGLEGAQASFVMVFNILAC
jgi:tRNA G46 methylase TrmB